MNLNKAVVNTRKLLNESQTVFAKRFGVSHVAVSGWENGNADAPNIVISFCIEYLLGGKAIVGTNLGTD